MAWRQPDRVRGQQLEEALAARLYGAPWSHEPVLASLDAEELAETARSVRQMVLGRSHRGTGGLAQWCPKTLTAWRESHLGDDSLDELGRRFCASAACSAWRELPAGEPGISLEEAFHRFFTDEAIGDRATRDDELLGAVVRALAVTPTARFVWPGAVRRAPGGCFVVIDGRLLHAAIDGQYLHGEGTALIAELLSGEPLDVALERCGPEAVQIHRSLRSMRLL